MYALYDLQGSEGTPAELTAERLLHPTPPERKKKKEKKLIIICMGMMPMQMCAPLSLSHKTASKVSHMKREKTLEIDKSLGEAG